MTPATVAAAAVIVCLTASGIAAFTCWRWVALRDDIRDLRQALAEERTAAAVYRLWLDQPVDELRTQTNTTDGE